MGYNEKIKIIKGDITKQKTEAIVNAANTSLLGGGGVDGAIHRAAGPQLLEACKQLNGCKTGEAKITGGFNLKAKYIIHTAGPVWKDDQIKEAELLANCYKNSLLRAVENKVKSIAFPSISTGVYRFPIEKASKIALRTIDAFLKKDDSIKEIIIVCFSEGDLEVYKKQFIGPDLGD